MPYRLIPLETNYYYHIFDRGVEKRAIFSDQRDYQRFLQTLIYYQYQGPKPRFSTHHKFKIRNFSQNPKIVEVICYCLMPNHYHLLVKQNIDGGIKEFMQKVSNSYTKYYNTKHNRVGPLFQGTFKAVLVENNEQLLHLSRYIHLNPLVSEIVKDLSDYPYSSYLNYCQGEASALANNKFILDFFNNPTEYQKFISDQAAYATELEHIKHLLIEDK